MIAVGLASFSPLPCRHVVWAEQLLRPVRSCKTGASSSLVFNSWREDFLHNKAPFLKGLIVVISSLWSRYHNYSLWIMPPTNPIRLLAGELLHLRIGETGSRVTFDNMIIALILFTSLMMGLDSCDLDPDSSLSHAIHAIDLFATAVFVLEMVAKIVHKGLIFTPHAYLANAWDRFDFLIVSSSLISTLTSGSPAFRVLRVLRVLRPLRLVQRFDGMKMAVSLLFKALPKVFDVMLICLVFLTVFAVLGVQLFAGKMASCREFFAATKGDCLAAGGNWSNPRWGNFDSFLSSALILFEMSTLEGWPDVLFAGIDATEIEAAPRRDANPANAVFFIVWVGLGSFCLLNLVVGVLVTTFYEIRTKEEGLDFMSEQQKVWADTMAHFLSLRPVQRMPCPPDWLGKNCWLITKHRHFETLISATIVLNTLLLALQGYDIPSWQELVLNDLNTFCTWMFIVEAAIKIRAYTFRAYIKDWWNVFDFSIVGISIIDWIFHALLLSLGADQSILVMNPTLARVLRILRLGRVLRTVRLVKTVHGLRMLLLMLLRSLPALANILGLFLVVLLVYSLLAMQLYGNATYGEYLNEDANFCHLNVALLTMFRSATGEDWNGLMHDIADQHDGNSMSWTAIPFFVSYIVLSSFIVLKMMIGIILENFVIALTTDSNTLQMEHADAFLEAWAKHDPEGTGQLHVRHLASVIGALPPPLGLDPAKYHNRMILPSDIAKYVYQMDLRTHRLDGQPVVLFQELLACLAKDAFQGRVVTWTSDFKSKTVKLSHAWGDVLPPASSTVGRKLYFLLEKLNIYRQDQHALSKEGFGGESIAASMIISAWTSKLSARSRETGQVSPSCRPAMRELHRRNTYDALLATTQVLHSRSKTELL